MSKLIECKKCRKKYGSWSFRKVKGKHLATCVACELEAKAARTRKKQESDVTNHLETQKAIAKTNHNWEEKAMARIVD